MALREALERGQRKIDEWWDRRERAHLEYWKKHPPNTELPNVSILRLKERLRFVPTDPSCKGTAKRRGRGGNDAEACS